MITVDAVVLDIDGVLVDESDSYRRAIVETVLSVYGDTIPKADVQLFKNAGGFNNDWELTHAAALFILARREGLLEDLEEFTDAISASGGGLSGAEAVIANRIDPDERERIYADWDRDQLTDVFQQLYLGAELYRELSDIEDNKALAVESKGFIHDEQVLSTAETIQTLTSRWQVGCVTGRPASEAAIALDRVGLDLPEEVLFTMDSETPGKPAPDALVELSERLEAQRIAFVGDTLDDVETAVNAERVAAEMGFECEYFAIGVTSGGLDGEEGRRAFEDAGADAVIETVNELPAIVEPISEG